MQPESKKHIIFAVVAIAVIAGLTVVFSAKLKTRPAVAYTAVKKADITQGVNVDGTVQSAQDLSLSFQTGGQVTEIDVKAGDSVKKGQTLVRLDTSAASAAVNQAQAAEAAAQANYQKLQNGATGSQLDVSQSAVQTAQTALDNAKKNQTATVAQQNLIVNNAQSALLNSTLAATPGPGNLSSLSPTISGTYTGAAQGEYDIKIYNSGSGLNFSYSGLESGSNMTSTTGPSPLGTKGLFIQFPTGTIYPNDTWTVFIPNTKASNYLTNLNSYNAALQTQNQATVAAQAAVDNAQAALTQAQSNLQLAQTPARPEDLAASKAQVDSASAMLQNAQNNYNNDLLKAPIDGTVTSVDTKVGQNLSGSTLAPGPDAVKMISSGELQVVTYVSEADIGKIKVGDKASVTLDAYGSGTSFPASVILIDPSATIKNGISTYKTTLQFDQNDGRIKTGMAGSVNITDQTDQNALIIPSTAIIKKDNQEFVLTQSSSSQPDQTQIQTGITDLNGNVEVVSGLSDGQMVATFGSQ